MTLRAMPVSTPAFRANAQRVLHRAAECGLDGGGQHLLDPLWRAAIDAHLLEVENQLGAVVHRSSKRYDETAKFSVRGLTAMR